MERVFRQESKDRMDAAGDDEVDAGKAREDMIKRKKDGYKPSVPSRDRPAAAGADGEPDAAASHAAMIARKKGAYQPAKKKP